MKVYIVVDCCSGEHYSVDDPTILFVSTSFKKAKQFFDNEIEDGRPEEKGNYDDNVVEISDNTIIYEITDYDEDTHRIIKLVEKELR